MIDLYKKNIKRSSVHSPQPMLRPHPDWSPVMWYKGNENKSIPQINGGLFNIISIYLLLWKKKN